MNRLNVGTAFAICGMIIFFSSGSVGDGGIINEAINALLADNHPFALVAWIGFGLMMLGALVFGVRFVDVVSGQKTGRQPERKTLKRQM